VIAKTGLSRDTGKWGPIASVAASVLPDVDGVLSPFISTESYLEVHRSLTNSVFLVIPFSLFLAWLFCKFSRMRRFGTFFMLAFVAILTHNFLDLVTSFGTMILSPLSDQRFSLDWVFIIDLYLAAAFILPMLAMAIWRRRARVIARVSVGLAVLYICLCVFSHSWALSLSRESAREKGLAPTEVAALPQPLSPFHWGNYIAADGKIYEGLVNLVGKRQRSTNPHGGPVGRIWSRYQPPEGLRYREWDRLDGSPWAEKAMESNGVRTFLWFARFPVARYVGMVDGLHRVELYDLRFGSIEGRRPFLYVMEFDRDGNLASQGFRNYEEADPRPGIL
jgi:inner membrane protein